MTNTRQKCFSKDILYCMDLLKALQEKELLRKELQQNVLQNATVNYAHEIKKWNFGNTELIFHTFYVLSPKNWTIIDLYVSSWVMFHSSHESLRCFVIKIITNFLRKKRISDSHR